ncbi:multidrug effflux MFS transporter [Salmonella enterica]|uniref:Bcr/CflA family efflux transporter n=3 Tax=Salmonella houtenae TaxID=59205 RepID=A0A702LL73_SALHO|nr:MFS transporter [Salmonella enterica subsp. houtenae]EAB2655390.1 Bcr/CflA family efflux MFS transporter [Salmonella enterica]EAW2133394.1 Bcr/CflA family efflux MFS transporter [Salmonella enterica subsp. enterica]EEH1859789.1 multidrug effflux MFS transporter [Salmonella enterica subsp. houtenae serovar 50:g,z51:-]ESE92017.1 Bcr/CflA subfamily drug resistance transporter [Salmonella enterica subsp. houtenae serovar 50:g,z51:- str. 01-0133]HAC6520603.1 Bcr/CflA family efflux MFS transporte
MSENTAMLSRPRIAVGAGFIILLSALMALTSLSTDIYLPAMPIMARALHGDAELTITGFLIGFTLAQLIWGPVSDHLGRKIPLFIGMVLFVAGSVGCATSTTMMQMVFWRVFQAMGACTGPMLARAMIRDLFSRSRAAQMLSTLMIVMAIAPIGGPLLGGLIIKFSTWPMIFWLLSATGVVMFLALLTLPETLPEERRVQATLKGVFGNYVFLLKNRRFMRYTLSLTSYYMAVYAFIAGSPLVYISYYGVSPQHYGWLFAVNIVGVMLLSTINRKLVQRHSLDALLRTSLSLAAIAAILLTLAAGLKTGGIAFLVVMMFITFSMNGVIAAASTAVALDEVPEIAGSASALIGALQYGSGIVSTGLLALFSDNTPWTMSWIIGLFTTAGALLALTAKRAH